MRVGLYRKVSAEELMLLNCGDDEDSWESLGLQEDPTVHPKGNQFWIFIGRTDGEAETPILCPPDTKNWLLGKDPDAGKSSKAGGEGDNRGWDGWMAWPMQWAWIWVGSGSWWWTGGPGVLQSVGSQSWTWLSNWTELNHLNHILSVQVSDLKYIHVQPSPSSIFKAHSTCKAETLHLLNSYSSFPLPLSLWQPPFDYLSLWFWLF